jgi:hypothetical protein
VFFNLQSDTGDAVIGYVVPDSFTGVPRIRVCHGSDELLVFSANEIRDGLIAAGRHETGACGFRLDVSMLPELPNLPRLEIFDADTGILVYRRANALSIRKKIVRLETQMFPLWKLDDSLEGRFQYFARGVEKYGRESVSQMFLLDQIDSIYFSGRILYQNFAFYAESGKFETIAILQEPHQELAERLMILNKLDHDQIRQLGMERDLFRIGATIEFARSLPFDDEKMLRRALRAMPPDVASVLANPFVRQLSAATPDEMPKNGGVATALDRLASFAIVGLRSQSAEFLRTLSEFLDIEVASLPALPQFAKIVSLGRQLKETGVVDAILESDCELYHHVAEAHAKLEQNATREFETVR